MKDKDGTITAMEEQLIKVITEHFKKMLSPAGKSCKEYIPHKLNKRFTAAEITQVAKS